MSRAICDEPEEGLSSKSYEEEVLNAIMELEAEIELAWNVVKDPGKNKTKKTEKNDGKPRHYPTDTWKA